MFKDFIFPCYLMNFSLIISTHFYTNYNQKPKAYYLWDSRQYIDLLGLLHGFIWIIPRIHRNCYINLFERLDFLNNEKKSDFSLRRCLLKILWNFKWIQWVESSILLSKLLYCIANIVVVQLLSCFWLFATPWTAAHQASQSFTISWSLLKLMSIESVSNHP